MNQLNLYERIFTLISLLLLMTLLGCQTPPKQAPSVNTNVVVTENNTLFNDNQKATYELALEALKEKSFVKAESLLIGLAKERPDVAGPWANLGLLNLLQQKPTKAKEYLSTALKLSPNMPEVLNLMGLLAVYDRQIKTAIDYYQAAIAARNDYANAHYNLALVYDIYLQDIVRAAKYYREYLKHIKHDDAQTKAWVEQLEASL